VAKKSGLGKGLGALLGGAPTGNPLEPPAPAAAAAPAAPAPEALPDGTRLVMVDPTDLRPNPKQPRTHFDEDALQELSASIRRDGVQEPVLVRPAKGGGYELISGERRVRASIMADVKEIPAVVRDVSDSDMLRLGLIENLQREDLNAIETAEAYQQLMEEFGLTQEQLADEVGKNRATVANTLRLLKLEPHVRTLVAEGKLSMGHARALLGAASPAQQQALANRTVRDGLSVRAVEELVAQSRAEKQGGAAGPAKQVDPNLAGIEDRLRRSLGTKVHLKHAPTGRGKIEIEYFSLDEFERILALLTP
jgi:ParB family chromosome partitioning protein